MINKPKLDFRVIIGFRELCEKPISLFTSSYISDVARAMRLITGTPSASAKVMLEYRRVLFQCNINRLELKNKAGLTKDVTFSISLWEPIKHISLGGASVTFGYYTAWTDKVFPEENLTDLKRIMDDYVSNHLILCTICKTPTLMQEITFYPFAGGACSECKETGKIPHVQTN